MQKNYKGKEIQQDRESHATHIFSDCHFLIIA